MNMSSLKKPGSSVPKGKKMNRKVNLSIIISVYNNGIRNNCIKRLEFRRKHK